MRRFRFIRKQLQEFLLDVLSANSNTHFFSPLHEPWEAPYVLPIDSIGMGDGTLSFFIGTGCNNRRAKSMISQSGSENNGKDAPPDSKGMRNIDNAGIMESGRCPRDCPARFWRRVVMETVKAVEVFEALASESRLEVFRLLVKNAPEGLVVGEIVKEVQIPATTLSFHLKAILHAGLITMEKEGRYLRYRANIPLMDDLVLFLTSECCTAKNAKKTLKRCSGRAEKK